MSRRGGVVLVELIEKMPEKTGKRRDTYNKGTKG
jgi:hypothetical protein